MALLLVPGSLRAASTNAVVLRTARAVAPEGVTTTIYAGLAELPHFNPDDDVAPLHPAVQDLRDRIHAAEGVVVSTPEYAGALPGSFKNLLDWTTAMIGADGLIADAGVRDRVTAALEALAAHVSGG